MKKILILLTSFVLFIACNQENNNDRTLTEFQTLSGLEDTTTTSKTIKINLDSLKVITPGENGVPLPKTVKAGNPQINPYTNAPITPGVFYLHQTKEEIVAGKKPIKAGLPQIVKAGEPKKYEIVKEGIKIQNGDTINVPIITQIIEYNPNDSIDYTIQNGDTIYKIKSTTAKQPESVRALPPQYKDNATYNIQYLDVDQGMPSSYVRSILEDSHGNLWFGTYGGGVSKYDGQSFTNYTEKQGLSNNIVWSILEDSKGNIWFCTNGGGISKYDGQSFTNYTRNQGLVNNHVWSILEDSKGNLWFGTNGGGVSKYDGQSFTNYTRNQGLANNIVLSILEDSNGNLWFGTYGRGVSKYDGQSFTNYTENQGLSNNIVLSILEDGNGNLWFGTYGGGVSKYDGQSFTNYIESQGLSNNYVWSILEDGNGNLWFGTNGGGVSKYDGQSFTNYTENQGLLNNIVLSILEDSKGNLWFGTYGGGVSKYDGQSFTNYTINQGLSNNIVMSIIEDSNGNMWFGTNGGGVSKYDGQSFTNYTKHQGLLNNYIWSILEDSKGNIWFGTNGKGVSKYDGQSFTNYTENHGLSNNYVWSILEDSKGNIWFGTNGGGVSKYDGQFFTNYTENQGLSNNIVLSILEDSNRNLWFGTNGGGVSKLVLSEVEGSDTYKFINYTENQGLSNNIVLSILEDGKKNIWISTERGLNFFAVSKSISSTKKEENNQKNINNLNYTIKTYGKQDGLKGLDFYANSVLIDSKNRAWWGSGKALTMLDLNKYYYDTIKKAPIVEFTNITLKEEFIDYRNLNDSVLRILQEFKALEGLADIEFTNVEPFYNYPNNLELPYNLNHITFNFLAIDWSAPHKIKYSFILVGADKDWSQPTADNKAIYRNLTYGKYTFKVKAIGKDGIWSEPFEYSFVIHSPWWHTWWARAIYFVVFIIILFVLFKWRTAKLIQRQKELENTVEERTHEIQEANEELNQQNEEIIAQRDEIEEQKTIVEEINYEVSESINYATRLQGAILPEDNLLKRYLSEHFVLFKPKDKVSGDFYWWANVENHTIITAADSTGHGVPGAFMSMLGMSFLREIVQKEYVTHTGVILRKLRKEIIKALKQTGEAGTQKDGMDMAIISIDHETNIVQFSGANNPLYIITERNLQGFKNIEGLVDNSNFKLFEVKPNKMPIAIYDKMDVFTTHEIQLEKGDMLYMFSDGFADQFGGPKGKKFKYKPFKRLLLENANKLMLEQKDILNQAFENWRGNLEQIDDVVVLGVKI